jgi:uncharacterized protein (DUF427 family)
MPATPATLRVEESKKRVRAYLQGQVVADSARCKLVWEIPHYPAYYFPEADVRRELLSPGDRAPEPSPLGTTRHFHVAVGERRAPNAIWDYPDSPILRGHLRLKWDAMDCWLEEEDEVFVHPHDPYKRIDVLHGSRHVEVSLEGEKLADSRRPTLVFETGLPPRYYLPKSDVRMDLLTPTDHRSGCAYKGFARYWSVRAAGAVRENLAWSYPTPFPEASKIAGLVAFLDEAVDVRVDDVAQPRPVTEFTR